MKKSKKKKEKVNEVCVPCIFIERCGQSTRIKIMKCPEKRVVKKDEE